MRVQEREESVDVPGERMGGRGPELADLAALIRTATRNDLVRLGEILDRRPAKLGGYTVAMALAERLLLVRTREGWTAPLKPNAMQRMFERRRGGRNIVLKARQLGMTTWASGRFFLKTIMRPGTLTLEVAHSREAAEEIFRIVHRFLNWLPAPLRRGPLSTSRANTRQIVFPKMDSEYHVVTAGDRNAGRGLTVQNLHCSEVARWPGDAAETLAGLRAALAPGAEVILESTPRGVGGCFYDEWRKAGETATVQHFFPWWMEPRYRGEAADEASLSEEERGLMTQHGLSLGQIGYRRRLRANFRGLAAQEYAEDAESCFLASGESVFELRALEERLKTAPEPVERRCNGELEIWLPPLPGTGILWRWTRPAAEAAGIIQRWKCWNWRRGCSVRSLPDTWEGWNWRGWRRRWDANTTRRGLWWSGITMAAGCLRIWEMRAGTRRLIASAGGAVQSRVG
jgi:hypothetical protein